MIATNKFSVDFRMENIDRDFDIFIVEKKSEKLEKTNILDLATDEFRARAVQYVRGTKAFVLFDKNAVSEKLYRATILEDYADVTVRKMNLLDEEECRLFGEHKRLLVQLLINSIKVPKHAAFSFHNISGKLLYGDPTWRKTDRATNKPNMLYFLEIVFDTGMYLNLKVRSFLKVTGKKGPFYLFDPKTGNFRRSLKTDSCVDDLFTQGSIKKNSVPYLDFSSFERFQKCKLGVMEHFLQDVEKNLSSYITLTPGERYGDPVFEESKKEKVNLKPSDISKVLVEWGVNIVDECQDENSKCIVNRLVQELADFYGIVAEVGGLKKNMYNIRLIHNEGYYEENDLTDPYDEDLHEFIVQHLTEEEHPRLLSPIQKKENPIIYKILVELILKGDVRREQISIYNWPKLSSKKCWTFVIREKRDELKESTQVTVKTENKLVSYYQYGCVQINQDGHLQFCNFTDMNLPKTDFEERIRFVFDKFYDEQNGKYHKKIEGLVFSDLNNIHAIIQTNERTMPNIRNIWKGLKETNEKEDVITGVVLEALHSYIEIYPCYTKYAETLKDALLKEGSTISKKNLKKLIHVKQKAGMCFNRFLHENYGIWVAMEIKNQDFEDDYLLENVLNIKYFEDHNTDGTGEMSFNYYVGPKRSSLQSSLCNASIIRQVLAEEQLEFKELLPLMVVDFVRIGQYTVLPFPFKYLREYMKLIEIKKIK